MANPTTRETLKQYCLRNLGKPVIDINVDDDQLEDRIDEGLQYFSQYHYDGIERCYLKYKVTSGDIDRMKSGEGDTSSTATQGSVSTAYEEANNYIVVPDEIVSVIQILPLSDKNNMNMFDVRYQLRLNDLYDFSSTSVIHYDMVLRHLDFLDHILVGEKPVRFNQHKNRLYIDMDWKVDISAGEYLIIECYRKLDPESFTDIYNDIYLKRYLTALFKRQWGSNLSKFNGVVMLGGVTLNGEQVYQQAQEEIDKLEREVRESYDLPVDYMIG